MFIFNDTSFQDIHGVFQDPSKRTLSVLTWNCGSSSLLYVFQPLCLAYLKFLLLYLVFVCRFLHRVCAPLHKCPYFLVCFSFRFIFFSSLIFLIPYGPLSPSPSPMENTKLLTSNPPYMHCSSTNPTEHIETSYDINRVLSSTK